MKSVFSQFFYLLAFPSPISKVGQILSGSFSVKTERCHFRWNVINSLDGVCQVRDKNGKVQRAQ